MTARVFSLDVHATWKCRHSGACCRAGWTIPVEPHARQLTGTAWLEPDLRGVCPQYDDRSSLCRLHRDHGERMLPHSCHHFPRRALVDSRGTFVSLSHFCPTAAALVVDGAGLSIVESPAAFPAAREYDGLDARNEWPPLLRANALFDFDSFARWEQFVVGRLGSSPGRVETTLDAIADAAERVRDWSVDSGALADWTDRALQRSGKPAPDTLRRYAPFRAADVFERVCDTVPPGLPRPDVPVPLATSEQEDFERAWRNQSGASLRYLGARTFASWTAYQSTGIRTQVAELFATAAVLRTECRRQWRRGGRLLDRAGLIEAVRASDWLLVHVADRSDLMAWLGEVES